MLLLTAPALADDEDYKLGPDSMRQDGVPQGTMTKDIWHSKVFPETVRDYWIYVLAQYDHSVYVRQSTQKQVLENRESAARQYAFAERAVAFGWPRDRVLVIDEDLGKSGRTAEGRSGFQRLVIEVTLNHVGLVLGLEMSRLARSSKDWHAFFEMCAIFGTLIADEDGVYDGNDANDRLLLGLKGIMSEMELHIMRKCRRGSPTSNRRASPRSRRTFPRCGTRRARAMLIARRSCAAWLSE
jgi:DNA invertase Pin-like site-specific DNA recombinase